MTASNVYRLDAEGNTLIEIDLDRVDEIFNSFDPAPFLRKDLDDDAERYLIGAFQELPLKTPVKLVVYLPESQLHTHEARTLPDAVHNYFDYQSKVAQGQLRQLFRQGRLSLVIGLAFLFVCLTLRNAILALGESSATEIASEGLLICGWVAMWRPLDIVLYEWWPVSRRMRALRKIARAPIELQLQRPGLLIGPLPGR
ncbi:MAG: hypothetical protein RL885_03985 [Planctomycetota bacterium]